MPSSLQTLKSVGLVGACGYAVLITCRKELLGFCSTPLSQKFSKRSLSCISLTQPFLSPCSYTCSALFMSQVTWYFLLQFTHGTFVIFVAHFCSKLQIVCESRSSVTLSTLLPLFQSSPDLYHLEFEAQGPLLLLLLFKDGVINQKGICSCLLWLIELSHGLKKAGILVFHLKSSTSNLYYT